MPQPVCVSVYLSLGWVRISDTASGIVHRSHFYIPFRFLLSVMCMDLSEPTMSAVILQAERSCASWARENCVVNGCDHGMVDRQLSLMGMGCCAASMHLHERPPAYREDEVVNIHKNNPWWAQGVYYK